MPPNLGPETGVSSRSPDRGAGRRSFVRGFRGANPLVLVSALVLAALVLAGTQYFFTSGMWSAVPLRVWLRADRATASGTYVSWTIANLRTDPPELPMVYLLGGSALFRRRPFIR